MKSVILNSICIVLSTALVVGACELFLRWHDPSLIGIHGENHIFVEYDEQIGWVNKPGAKGRFIRFDYNTKGVINSKGLRDEEHEYEKPDGIFRIAALGDSFTWGQGVERNQRFTELLEEKLSKTEIINMGCRGYGQDQELLFLKREGLKYQPNLIMVNVDLASDLYNNVRSYSHNYHKPFFDFVNGKLELRNVPVPIDTVGNSFNKWLSRNSAIWQWMDTREIHGISLTIKLNRKFDQMLGIDSPPLLESNLPMGELTCRLFEEIANVASSHGAGIFFVLTPQIDPENQEVIASAEKEYLHTCLAKRNIAFADLEARFTKYIEANPSTPITFAYDEHWNQTGHQLVADAIYEFLTSHDV